MKAGIVAILGTCMAVAQTAPGVHPRTRPADYAAVAQRKTATYAASVLSAEEVKHIFPIDISKTYLVFEIAYYPSQASEIEPNNFLIAGKDSELVHPADATTVASVIQQKNSPRPPSNRQAVYTSASVGYESGTDPYTGRRVSGVYTGAGVGVGPADPGYPYPVPPGVTPQDRETLEGELDSRALPQGSFTKPVAGFLYFPLKAIKKKSSGTYDLQYLSDTTGKVLLQVPVKSH